MGKDIPLSGIFDPEHARYKEAGDFRALYESDEDLREVLDTLAANLTPLGENYQQSLILTQLCLEEAPKDLLPFAPEGCVGLSSWGPRMTAFLARLEDPAFQARRRWQDVDPDLGDDIGE